MKFGSYAVFDNSRFSFEKEPDLWWEFKPITAGDELSITKFIQRGQESTNTADEKVLIPHTNQAIAMREVALSFAATNIPKKEGSDDPVLKPGSSVEQVESVLKEMPHEMFLEIWKALGKAYPFWGPAKAKEENTEDQEAKKEKK